LRNLVLSAVLVSLGATASAQNLTYGPIIGRGATPDQMIVRWGTDASTGASSLALRVKGVGTFAPVAGAESAGGSAAFDHVTNLTGLNLDTTYEYQVTVGQDSETHELATCPPPGAPMDLVFYGDSRNTPLSSSGQTEHVKVVGQILVKMPDLVMESGDLVYTGAYADYLSQLFPVVEPMVSSVPFMAVPGNHDNDDPLDLDTGGLSTLTANFARLFPTPQSDSANWNPYYSFVCGNARFIGLNSESLVADSSGDGAQLAFLNAQLQAAQNDPTIDHVFVWFHHSPYSPASGLLAHGDNATVQSTWVPLFADPANKVTAVFTGHDHIYARMDDGSHVVYVVSGGAGASLSDVGGTSKATTAASASAFNFVVLHVVGRSVDATAYDDGGNPLDEWSAQSSNSAAEGPDAGAGAVGSPGTTGPAAPVAARGCSFAVSANASPWPLSMLAVALAVMLTRRRPAGSVRGSWRC
jgi:MYXO-CTERM domain-containing protein